MTDAEIGELIQEVDQKTEEVSWSAEKTKTKPEESWVGSIISTILGSVIGSAL